MSTNWEASRERCYILRNIENNNWQEEENKQWEAKLEYLWLLYFWLEDLILRTIVSTYWKSGLPVKYYIRHPWMLLFFTMLRDFKACKRYQHGNVYRPNSPIMIYTKKLTASATRCSCTQITCSGQSTVSKWLMMVHDRSLCISPCILFYEFVLCY